MQKNVCTLAAFALAGTLSFSNTHAQNNAPYWSLAGNANATTSSKLGTTNGVSLRIYAGNVQRMIVGYSTGNVGIGTGASSLPARLTINTTAGGSPFTAQIHGVTKLFAASNGGFSIGSGDAPPVNGLYVSGNVGIGNTTVDNINKLHVEGSGLFTNKLTANGGVSVYIPDDPDYDYPLETGIEASGADGIVGIGRYRYGTGVTGRGSVGVLGSGDCGVVGSSGGTGIIGTSGNSSLGEYYAGEIGVYGESATDVGIFGQGMNAGLMGSGTNYAGVWGSSANGNGVFGEGNIGIHGTGTTYAGQFDGDVVVSGTFTNSDKNLKTNIGDLTNAMDLINKLKPRQYAFKSDAKWASLHLPKGTHYGLIAQELQEVLPNLVKETPRDLYDTKAPVLKTKDGKIMVTSKVEKSVLETVNLKAVNYTELIPIVIKGMQEQQAQLEEKDKQIASLQSEVAELRQMVLELKNGNSNTLTLNSAYLEQNTPNPVNSTTTIRYFIPEATTSATLTLTNAKGQVVKTVSLGSRGMGTVNINTTGLAAGAYHYSLYVDGKLVDTKRLVIVR